MSIISIRKMFEKKGCQVLLILVSIGVMLGIAGVATLNGITSLTGLKNFMSGGPVQDPDATTTAFIVAGKKVTVKAVMDAADAIEREDQSTIELPSQRLGIMGGAISSEIQRAALQKLATDRSVTVSEAEARESFGVSIDQQIEGIKVQMRFQPDFPQDADDAAIDAEFEKLYGDSPANVKAQMIENFETALADASTKDATLAQFLFDAVQNDYIAFQQVDDETVAQGFDQFTYHRLAITDFSLTPEEQKAKAEEAKSELEGGASFASVYKKFVDADSEAPEPITRQRELMISDPNLESMLALTGAGIVGPVDELSGQVVYQVLKIERQLPDDFEEQKESYKVGIKQRLGAANMTNALAELTEPDQIDWKFESMRLMYTAMVEMNTSTDGDALADLADEVESVLLEDQRFERELVAAKYQLYKRALPLVGAERKAEIEGLMEQVLLDVLNWGDSYSIQVELANLYFDNGDIDLAANALLVAAQGLVSPTPATQANADALQAVVSIRKTESVLTDEQADEINAEILRWRAEMNEYQAEQDELNRQYEEDLAKLNEEAGPGTGEDAGSEEEASDEESSSEEAPAEGSEETTE